MRRAFFKERGRNGVCAGVIVHGISVRKQPAALSRHKALRRLIRVPARRY